MTKWTEAKYPGSAVREVRLRHDLIGSHDYYEIGNVRIQHYGQFVCVASFTPGYETWFPGDTPKMNPDDAEYFPAIEVDAANAQFDKYVEQAKSYGWREEK